jgi:hypothetical protein
VRAGGALWLLSLITPDSGAHSVGAVWLVRAPWQGARLLVHALAAPGTVSWQALGLGLALLAGFAANLTLLLRPGRDALVLAAALPWIPWIAYALAVAPPWRLLYFYPWALGLLVVQAGRLLRRRGQAAEAAQVH